MMGMKLSLLKQTASDEAPYTNLSSSNDHAEEMRNDSLDNQNSTGTNEANSIAPALRNEADSMSRIIIALLL